MSPLYKLFESIFALFVENGRNPVGEDCTYLQLSKKLQKGINSLRGISDDLRTSLTHLSSAVVSLRTCFENLADGSQPEKNSTSKNELSGAESTIKEISKDDIPELPMTSKTEHLVHENTKSPAISQNAEQIENEILKLKASGKDFEDAMTSFAESKDLSTKVFKTADESERETKIIATKVRVICEIFGNLTNLTCAAEQCVKYISELLNIFNLQRSPSTLKHKFWRSVGLDYGEMEHLDDAMYINMVVFRFIKEFIRKPVPMLDWPMIDIHKEGLHVETYHPLLGKQSAKSIVDPFMAIKNGKIRIDSTTSAVNCKGEVFAFGKFVAKGGRPSSTRGIISLFLCKYV